MNGPLALPSDDRAVSVTLSYALNMVIATMLIGSLFVGTGQLIQTQHEQTIDAELEVIGQHIAANIMGVDRMVEAGGDRVEVTTDNQGSVSGSSYSIEIMEDEGDGEITLQASDPEVTTEVSFRTSTSVENTTLIGGDLLIHSEDGEDIEVSRR